MHKRTSWVMCVCLYVSDVLINASDKKNKYYCDKWCRYKGNDWIRYCLLSVCVCVCIYKITWWKSLSFSSEKTKPCSLRFCQLRFQWKFSLKPLNICYLNCLPFSENFLCDQKRILCHSRDRDTLKNIILHFSFYLDTWSRFEDYNFFRVPSNIRATKFMATLLRNKCSSNLSIVLIFLTKRGITREFFYNP